MECQCCKREDKRTKKERIIEAIVVGVVFTSFLLLLGKIFGTI